MSEYRTGQLDLASLTHVLAQEAREAHGVSGELAERARRITNRNFHSTGRSMSARDRFRARAYYWAVVRRHAVRDSGTATYRSRLILDSVEADLRAA
ncbi:MAG: hypothetical protein Q8K89_02205, partial [Actinomycetota bacterium]|nr:hypothetical protein [Actinomycetota bacterium]